jgi:hypothetical protein
MTSNSALDRVAGALARNENRSLKNRVKNDERNSIVLLDTSGSMESGTNSEQRKIDALRDLVYRLRAEGIQFRQIVFGSSVEMREDIPEPGGGTPLTEAIEMATNHAPGKLVVISDGIPDNPDSALNAARKLGVRIDCFYVGPRPSQGEVFMSQLSDATGGSSHVGDLGAGVKALAGEIKKALLALPAPIILGAGE